MFKVQYSNLINFVRSVDKIKNFRLVYQSSFKHPDIFLYGDGGLLTHWNRIEDFYQKHLLNFRVFDELVLGIVQSLKHIKQEDLDDGIIKKDEYKDEILSICTNVDKIDLLVNDIYSSSTILQFFNFTFQPDTLMYNLNLVYPQNVWDYIPASSKIDIGEGAKGLVVGIPTASAFMFLRALEGCIRKLCVKLSCPKPIDNLTFGSALDFLGEYYLDKGDAIKRQMQFLKYIKDEFRNPSAHPEKSFSQYEAEQLFQVVNVAINRIFDLYSDEEKGEQI